MISKKEIKYIRSLHRKKYRDEHQQFIIEGPKMVIEALKARPDCIHTVYGTSEYSAIKDFYLISEKELHQISTLRNPQQCIAICNYITFPKRVTRFYLALDTVQDPGNLGTILRLASWFGVEKIVASKETVDCYNTKVVQASMGAVFNVEVVYTDLQQYLQTTHLPVYGAFMDGESIYQTSFPPEGILLIGNEGNGIHSDLFPLVTKRISIPKKGQGESLNAAMATGIILSEIFRDQ